MVRKTVKDLDEEIDELRNVMTDVRRMVEGTYKRYEDLEKKVERGLDESAIKCSICKNYFKNEKDLKDHMLNHKSETETCDFKCKTCQRILKIGHENLKLYCHFFNNERNVLMVLSVYCCMNFQASVGMENCVNEITVCSIIHRK